jgi:alpha-tubulin suppressor-like RCC1 family protein
MISGRGNTTCVLTDTRPLTCWGYNTEGQLGIGTTTNSKVPVAVAGLDLGVRAVSAGEGPTCVVTTAGGVKCWGQNAAGQLGNGTTTSSASPVDVAGLASGVTAVSSGVDHACALSGDGTVRCWGSNTAGQLGDGTTTDSARPVEVTGLGSGAIAVTAGFGTTCAVTTEGAAKCWGSNVSGRLGNGGTSDSKVPVGVKKLGSGVVAIDANGGHACAVTERGAALCWGSNRVGQLGDGTTDDSDVPVEVKGLASGVTAISAGSGHTCALTETGAVKCWGFNEAGGLGNGRTKDSDVPVDVDGLDGGVIAITAGNAHSCALTESAVKCWGYNGYGGLGNDSTTNSPRPVDVAAPGAAGPEPTSPVETREPRASHSP